MSEKNDMVIELLREVREDQKAHSTILVELQQDVSKNTDDLATHIEGVRQNRVRIVELERPREAFKYIKRVAMSVGGVAAATLAILKLLAVI